MEPQSTSRHFIIGTAGHVDHGKTSLIRALTGSDTDRLREEQERGMSIDLGFAEMILPDGRRAGVIDVPGHERFLKNMLAGAGSIDLVVLVVAADEGVMPQTREHLDILSVLQTRSGLVAVTKADVVDPEWLEMMIEEIREQLSRTFLSRSPILPVSSITGQGLPELREEIGRLADRLETRTIVGPWRLPIDRVFTIGGFGTIVTGTLVAGVARAGDPVELQPGRLASRIRSLQVHGQTTGHAEAGSRVAMNLPGLEVAEVQRGWVAAAPGTYQPTGALDLRLEVLSSCPRPVKNRTRVRVYIGTAEVLARLTLLEADTIEPGESGWAQLRLEEPLVAARGDRCVLRFYSPMATIGGGAILDAAPAKHRRFDDAVLKNLALKEKGTPDELVDEAFQRVPLTGAPAADVARELGMPPSVLDPLVAALIEQGRLERVDGLRIAHRHRLEAGEHSLLTVMEEFHSGQPMRAGMSREELRSRLSRSLDTKAFNLLLARLEASGRLISRQGMVQLPGTTPLFTPEEQSVVDAVETGMLRDPFNPPSQAELLAGRSPAMATAVWDALVANGRLVRIAADLFLHTDAVEQAVVRVREHLATAGEMTAAEFRDLLGTSRKFAVPLLEHLDSRRVTRRQGDVRVLADPGSRAA